MPSVGETGAEPSLYQTREIPEASAGCVQLIQNWLFFDHDPEAAAMESGGGGEVVSGTAQSGVRMEMSLSVVSDEGLIARTE